MFNISDSAQLKVVKKMILFGQRSYELIEVEILQCVTIISRNCTKKIENALLEKDSPILFYFFPCVLI